MSELKTDTAIDNNDISIEVGDIVQVISPTNTQYHEKIFFVFYIDENKITLLNTETLEKNTIIIVDHKLSDESIQSINILDKPKKPGFAINNNLVPLQWVDIHFSGDVPSIITAEITNLEEDMIELQIYPSNDIIYIDFGYKGIPEDLMIEQISIRNQPIELREKSDTEEIAVDDKTTVQGDDNQILEVAEEIPDAPKDALEQLLIEADDIEFGEDLGAITQIIDVPDDEKRFGIDTQTNDMLDELLSTIPTTERTRKVLNEIHKVIQRYKELREMFSNFDEYGNANMFHAKGADYKPIVSFLENLTNIPKWIVPVVRNTKKLYDIPGMKDQDLADESTDAMHIQLSESRAQEEEIISNYRRNLIPDSQNKYVYFMNEINRYLTPFQDPILNENILARKPVQTNVMAVVNNSDDFDSTVINNGNIDKFKFAMMRYNTGLTRLESTKLTSSAFEAKRVQLTPNDMLFLKSFLFLPEPAVEYSRLFLPGTNLLKKTDINQNFLQYSRFLHKNTTINTTIVDNIEKEIDYDEDTFLKDIREVILDETIEDPEQYKKFLQSIIPRTKMIFTMIKKYVKGAVSFIDVLSYLEPFLIYQDDITYKQYEAIQKFLETKTTEFKKRLAKCDKQFNIIGNRNYHEKAIQRYLLNLFSDKGDVYGVIPSLYNIDMDNDTDSEIISKTKAVDGMKLFTNSLSFLDIDLQSSIDIQTELDKNVRMIQEQDDKLDSKCKNYVLAKKYIEIDELMADNDIVIYYDKKYDETRYDIMKEYETQRSRMGTDEFTKFVQEELIRNIGLSEEEALYEATNMILGRKIVRDGDYAVLEVDDSTSELPNKKKYHYYQRKKNKWIKDNKIPETVYEDNTNFFCNVQDKCLSIKKKCDNIDRNKQELKKELLFNLTEQFEESLTARQDQLLDRIKEAVDHHLSNIDKRKIVFYKDMLKYNDKQFNIGTSVEESEKVQSPYSKLRDRILSQADFSKKNQDIIQFSLRYTREPDPTTSDNLHWRYCKETNVPLLPAFFVKLANASTDSFTYKRTLDEICQTIGVLSDSGDTWVDKHSGYTIKSIELENESFEDTLIPVSRTTTEQDATSQTNDDTKRSTDKENLANNPESTMIYNIVKTMTDYMGIELNDMEFIIKNTVYDIEKQLGSEETYNARVEYLKKKGKKPTSYQTAKNGLLLLLTLAYMFISIQCAIPSIKTKKTFPGCVRSFQGFPLHGKGDESGLMYVVCIANKIKSTVSPWNTISRNKEATILKKIKDYINIITKKVEVQDKIKQKLEYNLLNQVEDVPVQHNISGWKTFLPPLSPFHIASLKNITGEFQKRKIGTSKEMLELSSKMYSHSLAIIEGIQQVIRKEQPLLSNMVGEPFLENMCCQETSVESPILEYFKTKNKSIADYADLVRNLSEINNHNRAFQRPPIIYHNEDTRINYPTYSDIFHEHSIYRAFIKYCKYNKDTPLPKEILAICSNNKSEFKESDPIEEKIRILKSEGKVYSNDNLIQLLQIISKNGITPIMSSIKFRNKSQGLRSFLELMKDTQEETPISPTLIQMLENNLDSFDVAVSKTSKMTSRFNELVDYIDGTNKQLVDEITTFLSNNSGVSSREFNKVKDFIKNISKWSFDNDDELMLKEDLANNKNKLFIKNCILSLLLDFPNMIINKIDKSQIKIPKHWKLSQQHMGDVYKILSNENKSLSQFYNHSFLSRFLEKIHHKYRVFHTLLELTPTYATIIPQKDSIIPIFNHKITNELYEHYFLLTIYSFIMELDKPKTIVKRDDVEKSEPETFTESEMEMDDELLQEVEVIEGESMEHDQIVASFLFTSLSILEKQKSLVDITYEEVMKKVSRSRDKEKTQVTTDFKELSRDERAVETIFKNLKLEKWSKGLQKGLTQYVQETYDEERKNLEKTTIMEMKLGKMDDVTEMNQDIYSFDLHEEERTTAEIEREVNDLSHLAEDDDYGDNDGDEGY